MKILIIRFSSFGDVVQTLSVAGALRSRFPDAEIHWVTRSEFQSLIVTHPAVHRVWSLNRSGGLRGLCSLARQLRAECFDRVYDAHNNLRSRLLSIVLTGPFALDVWRGKVQLLRRPIYRWRRFLLFRFRVNRFQQPFSGQRDLLEPLRAWGISSRAPELPQMFVSPSARVRAKDLLETAGFTLRTRYVALAPSAAYPLKRWPWKHWIELVERFPSQQFVVLGGSEDVFLQEIGERFGLRVKVLAGELSFLESAAVVEGAQCLVSNDTGIMHLAEQLGVPCIALMGPAPFGFPSRPKTRVMEIALNCRPCSKHGQGPCRNPEFQKCLVDISPSAVSGVLSEILANN